MRACGHARRVARDIALPPPLRCAHAGAHPGLNTDAHTLRAEGEPGEAGPAQGRQRRHGRCVSAPSLRIALALGTRMARARARAARTAACPAAARGRVRAPSASGAALGRTGERFATALGRFHHALRLLGAAHQLRAVTAGAHRWRGGRGKARQRACADQKSAPRLRRTTAAAIRETSRAFHSILRRAHGEVAPGAAALRTLRGDGDGRRHRVQSGEASVFGHAGRFFSTSAPRQQRCEGAVMSVAASVPARGRRAAPDRCDST